MPRISLRYRAGRTSLYSAAPGVQDVIRDQLDVIAAQIDQPIEDAYTETIKPAAQAAASAQEKGRAFLFKAADSVASQQSAMSGVIKGRAQVEAAQKVPTMGGGFHSVTERESAVAAAARQIETEMMTGITRDVVTGDAIQNDAREISTEALDTLQQLERVVLAAEDDWLGPSAIRTGVDLDMEEMFKRNALARELLALHPKRVLDMFVGYVERGQNDKATAMIDAYLPELPGLKVEPAGKLVAKYGSRARTDQAVEFRTLFDRLQNVFDQFRQQTTPQSIIVGAAIANGLRAIHAEIFGVNAQLMDSSEFARTFLNTDDALRRLASDPLLVSDSWIWRKMPIVGFALPHGWTPLVKTGNGIAYRKQVA